MQLLLLKSRHAEHNIIKPPLNDLGISSEKGIRRDLCYALWTLIVILDCFVFGVSSEGIDELTLQLGEGVVASHELDKIRVAASKADS